MPLNVLVVDDSAVMRTMVIRILKMSGVELGTVHQAENGREALDVVRAESVDLALVDVNMPVMNGEQLIEALRAEPATRELPVLVLSTESSRTRIERLMALGAAFVHKPFTAEVLRAAILEITGVSDERATPVEAVSGNQFDF